MNPTESSEIQPGSGVQVTASGHCPECSFYKRPTLVFHGVPWCPDVPAVVRVDWNGARRMEDEHGEYYRLFTIWPSRPVVVGEGVIWIDEFPMTGRGLVVEVETDPDGVTKLYINVYEDWKDFAEEDGAHRRMLSTDPRIVRPWEFRNTDTAPSEEPQK